MTPHVWERPGPDERGADPRQRVCQRCDMVLEERHVAAVERVEGWGDCDYMLVLGVMET